MVEDGDNSGDKNAMLIEYNKMLMDAVVALAHGVASTGSNASASDAADAGEEDEAKGAPTGKTRVAPAPSPPSEPPPESTNELVRLVRSKSGTRGSLEHADEDVILKVAELQRALVSLGLLEDSDVDGIFGSVTAAATRDAYYD